MAALDAWGGALLLESVGSGKTWIALAAAAHERGRAVAIVPAILRAQWEDSAARAGVSLHLWTHERASRGALPTSRPSLVIIDEAHRLREPGTRRVRTLAPWLVGCRTLLLTATPIVNRVADMITLLRLVLPEDALALDGVTRLSDLESGGRPPDGLRRVAIRSGPPVDPGVDRRVTMLQPDEAEEARGSAAVAAINQLTLSASVGTRRLLISVLLDAAASSDVAFHQALQRYRALLLQARDAGGASRAMLRRFAGESLEQLLFWPLLTTAPATADLPLADIECVEALLSQPVADEPWIRALAARCDDARPTICFTRHRATARQLRVALGDGTAWVSGSEAGIGPHRIPREGILAAFGVDRPAWHLRRAVPRMLIATDVAAEGLDLQSAGRVVHVDLPWTATRLEQREGRLLRIGQRHPEVEVMIRMPGSAIESALSPHARVRRKRHLADEWLQALAARDRVSDQLITDPVVATLDADGAEADLVALRLQRDRRVGVVIMIRERAGAWCCNGHAITALIARARTASPAAIDTAEVASVLAGALHAAIAACAIDERAVPALVSRIHRLARHAASRRDGDTLRHLDRLLRFATTAPTLGGRAIMTELLELSDRDFIRRDVPEIARPGAVQATVIAAMVLRGPSVP
jgi:hypothetical protein